MQLCATRTAAIYIAKYNQIRLAAAAAMGAANLGQTVDFDPKRFSRICAAPS